MENALPVGKLPVELIERMLVRFSHPDPRIILGPGVGLDCAVIDAGETLLVLKTDPITFATDEIGWYLVQVNANDIATTGAVAKWLLVTLLLPEGSTTPGMVEEITGQIAKAAQSLGIAVIGGHTEITHGLEQPAAVGTMIGEVARDRLITPQGATPGDHILFTKGVPIEGTSLLAREFPDRLAAYLTPDEITQAAKYLYDPGIGVTRDARIALAAGKVTAMHDPTEGGLASALWELAVACGKSLALDVSSVPIPDLAAKVCQAFEIDPLATIASGALLLTVPKGDAQKVQEALRAEGIVCADIGFVEEGPPTVWSVLNKKRVLLARPSQDEVARIFGSHG